MDSTTLLLLFSSMTQTFELPTGLLPSLCYVESHHKINAVNIGDGNDDSLGICQIQLNTARTLGFKGTRQQLMRPKTNIYYAAKYLKKQLMRYKGDAYKAIAAYNSGTYRPSKTGVAKNKGYVNKVFIAWTKIQ